MHKYLKLLTFIVATMAISCATVGDDLYRPSPIHKSVDPNFQEYLEDFKSKLNKTCNELGMIYTWSKDGFIYV